MKKNWVNTTSVEGYIYDLNDGNFSELQQRVTGEKSKNPGTPYISGTIHIATDDEALNIVPVEFTYVTEKYSSGKENPNFEFLADLIERNKNNTLSTFKTNGVEAEKVRISGDIQNSPWVNSRNGQIVARQSVRGSFINPLRTEISKEPAKFEADIVLSRVIEHEDDGYIQLEGYFVDYGKNFKPISVTVSNENGIKYFTSIPEDDFPFVTNAWGLIKTTVVERVNDDVESETAWGQTQVRKTSRSIRTWELESSSITTHIIRNETDDTILSEEEYNEKVKDWKNVLDATLQNYTARKEKSGFPAASPEPKKKTAPKRATAAPKPVATPSEDIADFDF